MTAMDEGLLKIERTPEGVDPYAEAGVEPPESFPVTAMDKDELAHMLRMCGTVRHMRPVDVAQACGISRNAAESLFRSGEGTVDDTMDVLGALRAHAVTLPPIDRTGRYL